MSNEQMQGVGRMAPQNTSILTGSSRDIWAAKYVRSGRFMAAASALAIAVAIPQIGQAQAVPPECDPDFAIAGATIVCVAAAPDEIDGISTTVDDLTIVVGDDDTPTTVRGMGSNGVRMDGDGDQTLNVVNAGSQIIGDYDGISIVSDSGALSINSAGTSTGNDGDGIYAGNTAGSADLTVVSEGLAQGSDNGISAKNYGSGALGISAQDSNGAADAGIVARNYSGTDLAITSSGSATGGAFGIYSVNYGSAALSIDAVDTAGAASSDGNPAAAITGFNSDAGTDLSITSRGTAISAVDGIFASNYGTGALNIQAVDVTGTQRFGIFAVNDANGTDLIITTTGAVSGGLGGISADNEGTGVLVINAAETYGGGFFDGIDASVGENGTGLSITTTGLTSSNSSGISANHYGSGAISINTAGEVIGGFGGISADNTETGTDLTIVASASISGGSGIGIFATNSGAGTLSITATDIVSEEADGIRAANAENSDALTIVSTGTVVGGVEGIEAYNDGSGALTIEVNNVIGGTYDPGAGEYGDYGEFNDTSNGNGITAFNSANGTGLIITSTGIAAGGEDGIEATNRGSGVLTINSNNTYGGTANPAATEYYYYGGFSNYTSNGNGIEALAGNDVTALTINSTGLALGGLNGIDAANEGTGALTISANDVYGGVADPDAGVYDSDYGYYNPTTNGDGISAANGTTATDLTITSTGTVIGGENGISAKNRGTGSLAISASDVSGGRVDPDADFGTEDGYYYNPTVDGNGIEATNGEAASDLTIASSGTVSGGDNGISAKNYGSGALSITANNSYGYGNDGILARNYAGATDLTIRSNGYAYGYDDGISAVNNGSGALTITAADSTGGNDVGIIALNYGDGPLSITSTGTASGAAGIDARNYGASALVIAAADTVGNASTAIFATNSYSGTDLAIVSTGTASGTGAGIYAQSYAPGTVSVTAADTEGGVFGILVQNFSGTDITVISTGTARGAYRSGINVTETGSGQVTIEAVDTIGGYSGIIAGSSGTGLAITSTGTASGGDYGIIARQTFRGDLIINAVDVTATSGTGIYASSRFGAENIVITSTGTVSGRQRGITALGDVAGDVSIDTVNTVGERDAGIFAFSQAYNSDITITSRNSSTGDNSGIIASGFGVEAITVSAKDTTGAGRNGIQVFGQFGRGDITVTSTGTAQGGLNGIYVYNEKSGSTIIDAVDTIGGELDGIYVYNTSLGGDLLISSTGLASGGQNGIQAINFGNGVERDGGETSGALRITAANTYGAAGAGIQAQNGSPDRPNPTFLPGSETKIISTGNAVGATSGIDAFNDGTGALTITANTTEGTANAGIAAINTSRATDLTITSGTATGGEDGISAKQYGSGTLTITANTSTGNTNDGIFARTYANATDLSVTSTGLATGVDDGISAENRGTGALTVTGADSTGVDDAGIVAINSFDSTSLTVVSNGTATGGVDGIRAFNDGTGALTIIANDSFGSAYSGIAGINSGNGTDLTITSTGTAEGAFLGVAAFQEASGVLTITANNSYGGYNGISARNEGNGTDINVTSTGTARGGANGVPSTLTVAALLDFDDSELESAVRAGIGVFNDGSGATSIAANNSFGGDLGIAALHSGTDVSVTSTGLAEGGFLGIAVLNEGSGTLSIDANDAVGSSYGGILAFNASAGDVSISSSGFVSGGAFGIGVSNYGPGTVSVSANNAAGGAFGITASALNGPLSVTTTGTVEGGVDGIDIASFAGTADVETGGQTSGGRYGVGIAEGLQGALNVRNTGILSGALAAIGVGAPAAGSDAVVTAALTNEGVVNGRVQFRSGDDSIDNSGTFNAAADSDFGAGIDVFTSTGTVTVDGQITFVGLEQFNNFGTISMIDGAVGDSLTLPGDYDAGSTLAIDANFDTQTSDQLFVSGTADGVTEVLVNNLGQSAEFGDSIVIVQAGAATDANAFVIDAASDQPANFLAFGIEQSAPGTFLLTRTISQSVFQPAIIAGGARALWLRSANAWNTAQDDRRDATGPKAGRAWVQAFGGRDDRDQQFTFDAFGPVQTINLDYKQTHLGLQAGFDIIDTGSLVLGLTGGYAASDLDFTSSGNRASYDTFNLGAYASYSASGLFGSVLAKYDDVEVDMKLTTDGYSGKVDGISYGGVAELGYRYDGGAFFIEPSATAEYAAADLDSFTASGAEFDPGLLDGFRFSGGAKLGRQETLGKVDMTVYLDGRVVHDADATGNLRFQSGTSSIDLPLAQTETYGKMGAGIAVEKGPVRFGIQGTYDIGRDYDGYSVQAGFRAAF